MRSIQLKLSLRVAWWFRLYMIGLKVAIWLTGEMPDMQKVSRVINRAIRKKVTQSQSEDDKTHE